MSLRSRVLLFAFAGLLVSAPVVYAHGSEDHGSRQGGPFGEDSAVYDPDPYEWEAQELPPHAEPFDSDDWNSDHAEPCNDHEGEVEHWPRLQEGRSRF